MDNEHSAQPTERPTMLMSLIDSKHILMSGMLPGELDRMAAAYEAAPFCAGNSEAMANCVLCPEDFPRAPCGLHDPCKQADRRHVPGTIPGCCRNSDL